MDQSVYSGFCNCVWCGIITVIGYPVDKRFDDTFSCFQTNNGLRFTIIIIVLLLIIYSVTNVTIHDMNRTVEAMKLLQLP